MKGAMEQINHSVLCYSWTIVLSFTLCLVTSAADLEQCNVTVQRRDIVTAVAPMTFTLPNIGRAERGHSLYCWFRFEAALAQYIGVDVKELNVGSYNDISQKCEGGYLRISDEKVCSTDPEWFAPTTICGEFEPGKVRVRRYTRSPSAFVEFHLDNYKTNKGYQFDVEFIDAGDESDLPYGHLQRKDGRVGDTKCDWLIPVNECDPKSCQVTSPGYPGIYPPHLRCRYLLQNFDDTRILLVMGGIGFNGKFDMKKADDCSTSPDYVEVYDGSSTVSKRIGRFCGHDGEYIVSSGPTLLLLFVSGNGTPPWDYSGFKVEVMTHWKDHKGGQRVPGSLCDVVFNSRDGDEAEASTPDEVLHEKDSMCTYTVLTHEPYYTHVELVIYKLLPDCQEYLEIYDGDVRRDRICAERLIMRRNSFEYNITQSEGKVVYYRAEKQVSNPEHAWIYYTYLEKPLPHRTAHDSSNTYKRNGKAAEIQSHPGSGVALAHCTAMTSSVLIVWLLYAMVT